MFEAKFDEIRSISKEMVCFSWTSKEYQDDVLNFIIENREQGFGVIEVGCYKGGLSALLAYICQQFDWPFYTLDIDPTATESTRLLLQRLELDKISTIHLGPLSSFVDKFLFKERPVLIILDGDHRYEAVLEDIQATYRLNKRPYAAVFHDFSLRHPTSGELVDQAARDSFGKNCSLRNIGVRMTGDAKYPTIENPSDDGHWWDVPGSEGAIVTLPPSLISPGVTLKKENAGLLGSIRRLFN
jgi:hypothetical protein